MKIAVAGGTGTVGARVVDVARNRGHDVVVLTRSHGVDLLTGSGLDDALAGVDAVIDVASKQTMSAARSTRFFTTTTHRLLDAETKAGVSHHIALSIVGANEAPHSYYAGKVAQERALRSGDVPWTVLRATQFHEFAAQLYGRVTLGPVSFVPKMRSSPVAAHEVAERLLDIAEGDPSGLVDDLGGPREENMADMVRKHTTTLPGRHWVFEVPMPGAYGLALRNGTLIPGADADHGIQTYADWLACAHS